MIYPKRLLIILLIMIAILASFWVGSRYPALQRKAHMAQEHKAVSSFLVPSPIIQVDPNAHFVVKVYQSTINWAHANRNGMVFGVTLGACFLTLLSFVRRQTSKNAFLNSLYGMAMGAPMGVCVNCAAPIAKGMMEGGSRIETSLATMFSSPTLNLIVLVMTFSLFPLPYALTKYAFTLLFILILLPIVIRLAGPPAKPLTCDLTQAGSATSCDIPISQEEVSENWIPALRGVLRGLGRNLIYIIKMTVPLMFLAGFLGALMTHSLPLEALMGGPVSLVKVVTIALVGVFLPLPIAFDIMVAQALFVAGCPIEYVMALLFTLGIYSVYSMFIVWTSHSKKLALILFSTFVILGIASGYTITLFQ